MAAVLAFTGWFLYARLDSHLTTALDHNLLVRAQDVAALVDGTGATLASAAGARFVERGESYAELLTPAGRVVDATSALGRTSLLSRAAPGGGRSTATARPSPASTSRRGCSQLRSSGAAGGSCSSSA